MRIVLMAIAVSILSFGNAFAQDGPTVESDWGRAGITWDRNGDLIIRFKLFPAGEGVALCMAYLEKGTSTISRANNTLLRRTRFEVNGKSVVRNLSFAPRLSRSLRATQGVGGVSKCKDTSLKASDLNGRVQVSFDYGGGSVVIN